MMTLKEIRKSRGYTQKELNNNLISNQNKIFLKMLLLAFFALFFIKKC